MKGKQKKERNRRRIRELELRAIRSQMNPHFIFNALSSIQNLINRSANQEANKYLIDFSRLLRKVLATSEKKLVPLSDEIEQLQLYLKLEQLRFPFSYSLTVDNNIEPDAIEIPGMLIQLSSKMPSNTESLRAVRENHNSIIFARPVVGHRHHRRWSRNGN